uniref:Cytochrome f n=1 Tax=Anotrichium furcellatum TaxID=41999 RepID=A0A4D6WN51_9FLOR|nr:Apocytochrome f [Anotrichium furcellatum]
MLISYIKKISILVSVLMINLFIVNYINTHAFPIYAQQGYENPREATGRIVCANCHLAQKNVSIEIPKSVLPNSVFEAKVEIPYDSNLQQPLSNGQLGSINTGAVLILPEGFTLAPKKLLSEELKTKTKNVYIQSYSTSKPNILVVGPLGGKNKEIIFPILSPDPNKNTSISFLKYPVYIGANRGRGQIYPAGDKTNNNPILASYSGKIIEIISSPETGNKIIKIEKSNGEIYTENIPSSLSIKVHEGNIVNVSDNLTNDPNVGGFGQNETEIVLQNPLRIKAMIVFFITVTLAQIFFVLKKKQWEKVQAADMNF